MKLERVILCKPYPLFRFVRDGKDWVCSVGKFYYRLIGD